MGQWWLNTTDPWIMPQEERGLRLGTHHHAHTCMHLDATTHCDNLFTCTHIQHTHTHSQDGQFWTFLYLFLYCLHLCKHITKDRVWCLPFHHGFGCHNTLTIFSHAHTHNIHTHTPKMDNFEQFFVFFSTVSILVSILQRTGCDTCPPTMGSRWHSAVMVKKMPINCVPFYFQNDLLSRHFDNSFSYYVIFWH